MQGQQEYNYKKKSEKLITNIRNLAKKADKPGSGIGRVNLEKTIN